jgi:hypothetical protein
MISSFAHSDNGGVLNSVKIEVIKLSGYLRLIFYTEFCEILLNELVSRDSFSEELYSIVFYNF